MAQFAFSHEETHTGGTKFPSRVTLRAHHPETGAAVGTLEYFPPRRKGGLVTVENLNAWDARGAGSALMDEMERRHPTSRVVYNFDTSTHKKPGTHDPNDRREFGKATDWDAHYPKLPGRIHRGMGIKLDAYDARDIHDADRPAADQAKVLYRYVRNAVGMHWSADRDKAEMFARRNVPDPRIHVPVVLHAEVPELRHIETRPQVLRDRGVWPHDHGAGDAEVPVKKRAPVRITGISWLPEVEHPEADEHGWVHHTFDEPQQHVGMRQTSIDEYFGGGHDAAQRTAGRGRPRRDRNDGAGAGAGRGDQAAGGEPGDASAVGGSQGGPWPVEFHPQAAKELKGLAKPEQRQVHTAIEGLAAGGQGVQTHALTGHLKGWYSTKASRGHRIVHQPREGTIYVGYVGLHDYDRAIRRLTSLGVEEYFGLGRTAVRKVGRQDLLDVAPYLGDVWADSAAEDFRRTLFTSAKTQYALMVLRPGQEIGQETHDGDQIFVLLDGSGTAVLEGREQPFTGRAVLCVPAGTEHNIVNGDGGTMLLATVYAPPQHPAGFTEHTKTAAEGYERETARPRGKQTTALRKSAEAELPLPSHLYHVTTAKDAVLAEGLKTRRELGQQYGHGLGSGPDDLISTTEHKELADHLLHSMHEYHAALNGLLPLLELKDKARKGVGANQPYDYMFDDYDHADDKLQALDEGKIYQHGFGIAGQKPGWEPLDEGTPGPDGRRAHFAWKRPATDRELIKARHDAYTKFSWGRQAAGGHPDPLFMGNDPAAFAKKDPAQFAIVHLRARPGATGIRLNTRTTGSDAGEWRLRSGSDVEVIGHQGREQIRPRVAARADDGIVCVYPVTASSRHRASVEEEWPAATDEGLHRRGHTWTAIRQYDAEAHMAMDVPSHYLDSVEEAQALADKVTHWAGAPRVVIHQDPKLREHAYYQRHPRHPARARIVMGSGGLRQDTLLHELAHHLDPEYRERGEDAHGPGFHEQFAQILRQHHPEGQAAEYAMREGLHRADQDMRANPSGISATTFAPFPEPTEHELAQPSPVAPEPLHDHDESLLHQVKMINRDGGNTYLDHMPDYPELDYEDWDRDADREDAFIADRKLRQGIAPRLVFPHMLEAWVRHHPSPGRWGKTAAHPAPTSRIFGPTHGLDHRLFDGERLRPEVRQVVLTDLSAIFDHLLGTHWEDFVKVYLAGSEASEWTSETLEGNGDFDTLLGVDYEALRGAQGRRDPVQAMTDREIDAWLNTELRERYNRDPWVTPFGTYARTGYVNADAYDIRAIKPYAAYDIGDDAWAVRPPHLPDWSLESFPEGGDNLLAEAEGYAAIIEAVDRMPEPFRTQQGRALWRHLHGDRARAFSSEGEGWVDPGNALEKILVEWGLWDKLVAWQYGPQKTAVRQVPEGIIFEHIDHGQRTEQDGAWAEGYFGPGRTASRDGGYGKRLADWQHTREDEYDPDDDGEEYLEDARDAPGWIHGKIRDVQEANTKAWDGFSAEERQRVKDNIHRHAQGGRLIIGTHSPFSILRDGRMKSLHELHEEDPDEAPKDEEYTADRKDFEHHVMGVDHDTDTMLRPIYGAVLKHPGENAAMYGRYQLELKPHIRERTTVTNGDSLNEALRPYAINRTHELTDGQVKSMSARHNLHTMKEFGEPADYMEFQVHGGVRADDIEAIHLHGPHEESHDTLVELARPHGIKVYRYPDRDPYFNRDHEGERLASREIRLDLGNGSYAHYRPGMASHEMLAVHHPDGRREISLGGLIALSNGEILDQIRQAGSGHEATSVSSKTASDAGDLTWRMQHRPPDDDFGAPLHDLAGDRGIYPEDVYTHPQYYDPHSDDGSFWDAYSVAHKVRGNPEALVRIYRALPAEHAHQGFRPGDWVTTSKAYARQHGRHHADPKHDWPVISTRVPAKHLHTEGNDLREYGYNGPVKDMPMLSFKGGYHQEVRQSDKDGMIRPVKRRAPKTAMPSRHYPPPEGFHHEIHDLDPDDNDYAKQEGDWPGWHHRILYGHLSGHPAGHIVYSESPSGGAISVGMMQTYRGHAGKGLASAMQDALAEEHPRAWINHGSRTGQGVRWWDSYDDPAPDRNIHNFPHEQWMHEFDIGREHDDPDRVFGERERPVPEGGLKFGDVKGKEAYVTGFVRWNPHDDYEVNSHRIVHDKQNFDHDERAERLLNHEDSVTSLKQSPWHKDYYSALEHAEAEYQKHRDSHHGPMTTFVMHKDADDEFPEIHLYDHQPGQEAGHGPRVRLEDQDLNWQPVHDLIRRSAARLDDYFGGA